MLRVLVVDDEEAVRAVVAKLIRTQEMIAEVAASGLDALTKLDRCDIVLTDVRMPGLDGLALLEEIKHRRPELPVLIMTGHATVPMAVEAMRAGALNFITKPFEPGQLLQMLRAALRAAGRHGEDSSSMAPPGAARDLETTLLGRSSAMARLREQVWRIARSDATVLITGESGSGKEVVARAVHAHSRRAAGPFVAFHCGGIPEALAEAELFGYVKGAFSGAAQNRHGYFGAAEGGTLLLDEIGELPMVMQTKLLRVLQEHAYTPLGTSKLVQANVRVLAATHRDLEGMVAVSTFREDLYYRLNVLQIEVPPLRERTDDVIDLARLFLARAAREEGQACPEIDADVMSCLERYRWPGNVRELEHTMRRMAVMAQDDVLRLVDLPPRVRAAFAARPDQVPATAKSRVGAPDRAAFAARPDQTPAVAGSQVGVPSAFKPSPAGSSDGEQGSIPNNLKLELARIERGFVLRALQASAGNRQRAADLLGIRRTTLVEKLKRLGVSSDEDDASDGQAGDGEPQGGSHEAG